MISIFISWELNLFPFCYVCYVSYEKLDSWVYECILHIFLKNKQETKNLQENKRLTNPSTISK